MKISDLLPPERVREIAEAVRKHPSYINLEQPYDVIFATLTARAVLEWAAERMAYSVDAERLRQLAKEIKP